MIRQFMLLTTISLITTILFACSKDDDNGMQQPDPQPEINACDTTLQPVVFVHGFLASGDTYEKQSLRLMANKFCPDRIFLYDWNSLGGQQNQQRFADFIQSVLTTTGAEKVFLAGHSAGSNLCFEYIFTGNNQDKVSHYVHLAGNPRNVPEGADTKVLNIYSTNDPIVTGGDMEGAENVRLFQQDHYEVATSETTFTRIFNFFLDGKNPERTDIPASTRNIVKISGKAITFGENQPISGGRVEVYDVNNSTGIRRTFLPQQTFEIDANGNWGPFEAENGQSYEILLMGTAGTDRPIHYYRSAFTHDNPFVYLRGLPPPTSPAGLLLSALPRDDEQCVVALFTSNQSVIYTRDELECNEVELSGEQLSPAQASNIAFFLYDSNNNRESDGTPIGTFALFPFLTGVDVYFSTDGLKSYSATFNEKKIHFQNWKSGSEGIIVVVFD